MAFQGTRDEVEIGIRPVDRSRRSGSGCADPAQDAGVVGTTDSNTTTVTSDDSDGTIGEVSASGMTITVNLDRTFTLPALSGGSLTILSENNYTSVTKVNAGTLQAGSVGVVSMVNSQLSYSGGTIDNNSAILNIQNLGGANAYVRPTIGNVNVVNAVNVTNTLVAPTTGTLLLGGENSYTGPTIVNSGTLEVGNISSVGSITSASGEITVNTTPISFSTGSTLTINPIAASSGTINLMSGVNLSGTITGASPVILNSGTLTITGAPSIKGILTVPANGLTLVGSNGLSGTTYGSLPQPFLGTLSIAPTVVASYHATDLGDLATWVDNHGMVSPLAIINRSSGVMTASPLFLEQSSLNMLNVENLDSMLDPSSAGWSIASEYSADALGDITVGAVGPDGTSHAVLLSPVPEPASEVLAGCGLATLFFMARRRVG